MCFSYFFNSICTCNILYMNPENNPPPPPPPPPPAPLPTSPPKIINPEKNDRLSEKEKIEEFHQIVDIVQSSSFFTKPYHFFSHYTYLEPQLQDGPKCGLVALSIASRENINMIFDRALNKGFTKQGEMFSAEWLAQLSEEYFDVKLIENGLPSHIPCILHCLLNDGYILIPYDADFNHSPCLKKGHKSHWAIISGFVIFSLKSTYSVNLQCGKNVCKCVGNFKINNLNVGMCDDKIVVTKMNELNMRTDIMDGKLFLAARHGKSKHLALWGLDDLAASNLNLTEFSPDRRFDEYVLPQGGVSGGLNGKAILLYEKKF